MNDYAETPEAPKKNNTMLIVAIIVVILCCCCLIIALGGWFLGDCLTDPNDPALCPLALNLVGSI
jgi:hypothetical protein